jgi:hypothetical protein
MKQILLVLYLLLIVAGGVFIVCWRGGPQVKFVAAQKLPANHLLQPGDLLLRIDGRQYVTRSVEAGELVDLREIGSAPDLAAKKGVVPFSLPAERDQVVTRNIDVGKTLLVCPPKVQAEVRAVFCGDGAGACIAILDVAEADAGKLNAPTASKLSLQKACG